MENTKKNAKILIVDDDVDVLLSLELLLKQYYTEVIKEKNVIQLPNRLSRDTYDLYILDMNFTAGLNTGNEGIFWMKEILKKDPTAIIILITAYGDVELAVKAVKEGASDFILKPWENEKLLSTIDMALKLRQSRTEVNKLKNKQKTLKEDNDRNYTDFIGDSPGMIEVFKTISKVAKTDANILIMGENGTGKELVARELHRQSKRSDEVFISVDMSAISESLFESELFGALKGSYTDSKEDRIGRFEVASGGTLFLDEIGNLTLPLQAKILTAIQNREIFRLGGAKPVPIDIRLISATNKPLYELIENGAFREDLLYRINTIQIELPPLRNRKEDIPLLSEHYLKIYSRKYERGEMTFHKSVWDKLTKYSWPGNIRELQHSVEKAVILSESNILTPDDFLFHHSKGKIDLQPETFNLEDNEKVIIRKALDKNRGNMSVVARELGITRTTLYNKIEKYGL